MWDGLTTEEKQDKRIHLYLLNLTVKLFLSLNGKTSHQSEKTCITAIYTQ